MRMRNEDRGFDEEDIGGMKMRDLVLDESPSSLVRFPNLKVTSNSKWVGKPDYYFPNNTDKPARLIIRLLFGFVSDSVSRKKVKVLRRQCCQGKR